MSYLDLSTGMQPEDVMYSECDHECLNCTFECDDPQYSISTILEGKGYREINLDLGKLHMAMFPCLKMGNNDAVKLKKNMAEFGINVQIKRIPNCRSYVSWVFFSGYKPEELLHIFRKLEVI